MLTLTWQMNLFIFETLVFIPIYSCLLVDFVVSRRKLKSFRSPYYSLMVSQGLADISTIAIFSSLIAARYFAIGNLFIYSMSPYSAIAFTNSGPFMFTLRCVGVFLITTQRYLSVCKPHGVLNWRLERCPPLLIGVGHWLLAFFIYLPALLHSDAYFENEITLFTVASKTHQMVFSFTVIASFSTVGVSIILMYYRIAIVMIRARKAAHENSVAYSSKSATRQRTRDTRLTLHIFILVIFCFIGFFYYIGEFVLAFDSDLTNVRAYRLFYPTVSGNLSFINPIMLLTLNKDVQTRIRQLLCPCHSKVHIQKFSNRHNLTSTH